MDDRYIIDKVIKGDTNSYTFLVNKYKRYVLSIAFQITGNYDDAEEIAQDVFIKAFSKLRSHKKEAKFSNWIYKIAHNTAISKKRRFNKDIISIEDSIETDSIQEIEDALLKLEIKERDVMINKAVDKLNPEEKLLISLKYYNDCSVDEIAEITDQTNSNVKIKLFRIRKRLYAILNPLIKQYLTYLT